MEHLQRVWLASRERLPFRTPGSVSPFWDLLMLQLLRPNSSKLPCLYSTFHLEYPLVLSRFCLVLGREGPYFVKEHSDSKNKYTEEDIIKMLEFLVDNIFVVFAGKVFQQIVGIPMGTNCAPLLARAGTVQDFHGSVRFRFSNPRFDFFRIGSVSVFNTIK